MKRKTRFFFLTMTAFACMPLFSCNGGGEVSGVAVASDSVDSGMSDEDLYAPLAVEDIPDATDDNAATTDYTDDTPSPTPAAKKKSDGASTVVGGRETLYISTYGANGKVWGHVTMNGNTGRGTIHDDDENTLSITVRRHGGELFGVDQNGREYVFKM